MIDYIYIFGDIVHNFHLIVTEYELVRDMTCIFVYINFHRDVSRIVDARVLTDKQTNKQTNSSENILPARSFASRGELCGCKMGSNCTPNNYVILKPKPEINN